jgi:high affinity Mn2+ porin
VVFLLMAGNLLSASRAAAHGSSSEPIEDQAQLLHPEDGVPPPLLEDRWNIHFQTTLITQYHPDFQAKYTGVNSMLPSEPPATAMVATIFATVKLWRGLDVVFSPELSGGSGLSQTLGVAAYPDGEVYRVGNPMPSYIIGRCYLRATFGLGGDKLRIEPGPAQLAETLDSNRLTLYLGRVALPDVFDGNAYSHDPNTQFLGWGAMDSAAWDYAADTHGYTYGLMADLSYGWWSARFGALLVGQQANQMAMEWRFWKAGSLNGEFESRWKWDGRPGAVRLASFMNDADAGNYQQAVAQDAAHPDVTTTRAFGRIKYGFVLSADQEIVPHGLGMFARLSWNDGHTESWSYTEVDESGAIGAVVDGHLWARPQDTAGAALVVSGLSDSHRQYLAAGGHGFIIGDGALRYAPEVVGELNYKAQLTANFALSGIYQPVVNPAFNQDRGPIHFFGIRVHCAF